MSIFSCDGCNNAILQDDQQIGCAINAAEILGIEKSEEKFYQLDRVCLSKNEKPDVKLGYIFILKDENDYTALADNLLSIKDKNPIWIGIINYAESISGKIVQFINANIPNVKFNVIANYDPLDDFDSIDKFNKHLLNGWTYVNIVGQYFDSSTKDKLQKFIIDNHGVAGIIKDQNADSVNHVCFFNFIFKYLKGSKPKVLEDETVEVKNFFEKVEEQSSSMIVDWSKLQ